MSPWAAVAVACITLRAAADPSCSADTCAPVRSDELCRLGIRNGEVCCAASCGVCGGPTCSGSCCGGYVKRAGLICRSPEDVTCLIPGGKRVTTTTSTTLSPVVAANVQDMPQPPYVFGRKGANACPAGSRRIENLARCRVALAALRIKWERKLGSSIDPRGCFALPGEQFSKGFFNTHPVGADADAEEPSLVCRKVESDEWCSKGLRKDEVCCAASCSVCGGPTCQGNCCGGTIKRSGEVCRSADDVSCLIPRPAPEPASPVASPSERLCGLGKRSGEACCASSCKVCGGPYCSGSCCGGYMKRAGRYCKRPEDVTCLMPQDYPF